MGAAGQRDRYNFEALLFFVFFSCVCFGTELERGVSWRRRVSLSLTHTHSRTLCVVRIRTDVYSWLHRASMVGSVGSLRSVGKIDLSVFLSLRLKTGDGLIDP